MYSIFNGVGVYNNGGTLRGNYFQIKKQAAFAISVCSIVYGSTVMTSLVVQ